MIHFLRLFKERSFSTIDAGFYAAAVAQPTASKY